jgi:hypothetical protein
VRAKAEWLSYSTNLQHLAQLTRKQIVTIEVLHRRGQSATHTARPLGVTEGTVRYHRRRARDGRQKPSLIEQLGLAEVVGHWWQIQAEAARDVRPSRGRVGRVAMRG